MKDFQDAIRANGFSPPPEIQPGEFYRFPGKDKKKGNRSGGCKLFPDGLGGIFGDFSTGLGEVWQAKQEFTPEEKAAFAKQVEAERKEREAERAKAKVEIANKWDAARVEMGQHRYLRDKGIHPYGLRTNGESLLIPLRDTEGTLHGIQYIHPHGGKQFSKGSCITGHYFAIGKPNGKLLVCEGYATGASLLEATGHAVAVAFNAGNLKPVAEALRRKYPHLPIIIAADNDQWTEGNPGITKGKEAAEKIEGPIVCPAFTEEQKGDKPTDFNDLHRLAGLEAVKEGIESLMPGHLTNEERITELEPSTVPGELEKEPAKEDNHPDFNDLLRGTDTMNKKADNVTPFNKPLPEADINPPCFAVHDEWVRFKGKKLKPGLYWHATKETDQEEEVAHTWIASPIHIEAITRNTQGEDYGRLLRFINADSKWREWAMPMRLLKGSGEELRGELLTQGVLIDPKSRGLLTHYLMAEKPTRRVTAANHVGWHDNTFIFPKHCIGSGDVVFQSEMLAEADYTQRGTLKGWQQDIGRLCADNPVLMMAISAALAGPLMFKVDRTQGAGIHFLGDSSKGKSTAIEIAASVWGSSEFVQSWSHTANGLEGIAAARSDTCLILDEINEASPHEIGRITYMIANGRGKGRANRVGRARAIQRWRVVALSTGERTLSAMMGEIGRKPNAGQNVRLLNIPSTGFQYGVFDCLHRFPNGRVFADHLKEARHKHYGHVGPAFIERLINEKRSLHERLTAMADEFKGMANTEIEGRAASSMALFALAGELGIEYGLLPWAKGAALEAAKTLFTLWRDTQEDGGNEDTQILNSVQDFIDRHGDSRFQLREQQPDNDTVTIRDRAGWFELKDNERVYLFHSSGLKEAGGGFDIRRVAQALDRAGWIVDHEPGRLNKKFNFRGYKGRLYVIKPRN